MQFAQEGLWPPGSSATTATAADHKIARRRLRRSDRRQATDGTDRRRCGSDRCSLAAAATTAVPDPSSERERHSRRRSESRYGLRRVFQSARRLPSRPRNSLHACLLSPPTTFGTCSLSQSFPRRARFKVIQVCLLKNLTL